MKFDDVPRGLKTKLTILSQVMLAFQSENPKMMTIQPAEKTRRFLEKNLIIY